MDLTKFKELVSNGYTLKDLAEYFNVSSSTISYCNNLIIGGFRR